jgi:hypothetical protein
MGFMYFIVYNYYYHKQHYAETSCGSQDPTRVVTQLMKKQHYPVDRCNGEVWCIRKYHKGEHRLQRIEHVLFVFQRSVTVEPCSLSLSISVLAPTLSKGVFIVRVCVMICLALW